MNLPAVRAVQSPETTNALQQYSNRAQRHWERVVSLLRREALEKGVGFNKGNNGQLFLSRICDHDFFCLINPHHPEYVIQDLNYISDHSLVTKNSKGLFCRASLISHFEEIEPGIYKLIFGTDVVEHYLAEALTVEYDATLIDMFKTKPAPILYKKGCLIISNVLGVFEMSEEEIRLMLSIDLINDIDNLKKKKISDINNLPITYTNEYDRFDHIVSRLIDPALEEIRKAYEEGRCPFVLRKEVKKLKVKTGKRGAPKRKNYISFYIEKPDTFVEAEEINDDTLSLEKKENKSVSAESRKKAVQMEIPFSDKGISTEDKLTHIEDLLNKILKESKGFYYFTERYPRCIIFQIRDRVRYPFQSSLPDAVLAWIEYTRKEVNNAKGIARLLQAHLAEELCLVYEGKNGKGTKDHLKWDGKTPVKFPPNQGASDQEGKDMTDSSVVKDWYQVWTKCRQTATKSAPECLSLAFELMFYTNFSATEKRLTIQVPSFIIREYVLMIKKSEFNEIIKQNFGDDIKCEFIEKYNAGSADLLKKFQKLYESELTKYKQQIESVNKGRLEKLKEIWQECQTELGNRDRVFAEQVSLESYTKQNNTLLLRVPDKETYEYLENKYVSLMNEVFQRHFRVAVNLNYRINPKRIEPQIIDSSFESEPNLIKK